VDTLSRCSATPVGLSVGVQLLFGPNNAPQFQQSVSGDFNSAEQFGQYRAMAA
jgi:hypothetical protein